MKYLNHDDLKYEELMDHIEKLANDPAYIPPMKKLPDYIDEEKLKIRVFQDIDDAKTWLEIDLNYKLSI
jgi:hypothetical protein